MAKRKLLRIREKTYERLGQVANDEELSISELADRVLSSYLENLEEEENNEEDQYDRLNQRGFHFRNRLGHEEGRVVRNGEVHTCWEIHFQLLHLLFGKSVCIITSASTCQIQITHFKTKLSFRVNSSSCIRSSSPSN